MAGMPVPSEVSSHHLQVDRAKLAFFSPKDQIIVVTFSSRLLKFRASSGEFLCEVQCYTVLIIDEGAIIPWSSLIRVLSYLGHH